MKTEIKSVRAFIGAKDYLVSRSFYRDLGWEETIITHNLSLFTVSDTLCFYLQDAYVADWVNNTMIFIEVANVEKCWEELNALNLSHKYKDVRLVPIRHEYWGQECFLHDPSGILWHFGEFNKKST